MTVALQTPINSYTANGVSTVFAFNFEVPAEDDLTVYIDDTVQASGFSLAGVGDDAGGSVTFDNPPDNNSSVVLIRSMQAKRETDYQNSGDFRASTVNADLDKLWLYEQQQDEELARRPELPIGHAAVSIDQLSDGALLQAVGTNRFKMTSLAELSTSDQILLLAGSVTLNHDTVAAALNDTTISVGMVVRIKENGGVYDAVAWNTATEDSFQYHTDTIDGASFQLKLRIPARIDITLAGGLGDGVTDNSLAFARVAPFADTHPIIVPYTSAGYKFDSAVPFSNSATIIGLGKPRLFTTEAGVDIFSFTSQADVTIKHLYFEGAGSSTVPTTGYGGFAAANTGLVTCTACTNVKVYDCDFSDFHNGLTTQNCDKVWIKRNNVTNFYIHGILASLSTKFWIDHNDIQTCDQSGAAVAYGVHATGDEAGGNKQEKCSISFNNIDGVPSWDGIMTHDVDGIRIIGNDIRNVRQGIDVGHVVAANIVTNIIIANNDIRCTDTDTWAGAPASVGGILVSGYNASNRVDGVIINANKIRDFFTVAGMVGGGNPSNIVISNADDVTATGNIVKNSGSVISNAGIRVSGTCNGLTIGDNQLQGTMVQGAIRLAGVTSDIVSINGGTVRQATSTNSAVEITGSTISAFAYAGLSTNSTVPFAQSTSTVTLAGMLIEGSAAYNPPSLSDGAGTSTTVTVTGAAVGDFAEASFGGDISGITLTAYVSAANTVTVRFQNESGGVVDLGSSTLRARVYRKH